MADPTLPQEPIRRDLAERSLVVDGNRLTLLTEGHERLEALLGLIASASTSLRLLYYTFLADSSGEAVRDALIAAAERGIKVSLLIDGFGSSTTPDGFFTPLVEAGARFCRFNPSYGRRYLLRNHQKLALADAEEECPRIIIGGFNVADDYFRPIEAGAWRDLGLIVEGPCAARMAPYFDKLMSWSLSRHSRMSTLRNLIRRSSETEGRLQWQLGGLTGRLSPWGVSTGRDLLQSCDIEMIAAYFAPTWGVRRRIPRSGRRARLITASKSDNNATIAAARFTYGWLLPRRVEVFEYRPTKLHTKLIIMDDVAHVGSSNLDIRSLYLNMEVMLRVDDPEFAQMMRTYFEGEVQQSLAITPELYRRRATLLNRIRWAVSFFLVAMLDYGVTRRLNFDLTGD